MGLESVSPWVGRWRVEATPLPAYRIEVPITPPSPAASMPIPGPWTIPAAASGANDMPSFGGVWRFHGDSAKGAVVNTWV